MLAIIVLIAAVGVASADIGLYKQPQASSARKASCSDTCYGENCDHWSAGCGILEEVYGCSCGGCACDDDCDDDYDVLNYEFYVALVAGQGILDCEAQQGFMTDLVNIYECYGGSSQDTFNSDLVQFCEGVQDTNFGDDWNVDCGFTQCKGYTHGSCANQCGFDATDCFCDEYCLTYGDCCNDYQDECVEEEVDSSSCYDRCGDDSRDLCKCDAYCDDFGDCCSDFEKLCQTDGGCYIISASDEIDCTFADSFTFIGLGYCRGYDSSDKGTFDTVYVDALEMCGEECLGDDDCKGFAYLADDHSCRLHYDWVPTQTRPGKDYDCWARTDLVTADVQITATENGGTFSYEITYYSPIDIVGFEISECDLTAAYGGDAEEYFYLEFGKSSGIVIGVSLDPQTSFVAAGEGTLLYVEGNMDEDCVFTISDSDANSLTYTLEIVRDESKADVVVVATETSKAVYEISFVTNGDDIAGFEVEDCPNLTDGYGGLAGDNFYIDLSTTSGILIAVSFTGGVISETSGALITLEGFDEGCTFIFANVKGEELSYTITFE